MGTVCFKDSSTDSRQRRSRRNNSYTEANAVRPQGDFVVSDAESESIWILNVARSPLPPNLDRMSVSSIRETCSIDMHVKHTLKGVNLLIVFVCLEVTHKDR